MNEEKKKKILKIAKKAIVATHKISIFGLKAYLNYKTGEIKGVNKTVQMILVILLAIKDYYYAEAGENKKIATNYKVIEKFEGDRRIIV